MSSKKEFTRISPSDVNRRSVSALAIRPNDASRFGQGGLSAKELQAWFDNLSKDAIGVYNKMAEILSSEDATKYIGLYSEYGIDNLYDFIALFRSRGGGINDKNISDYIEALYQKADDEDSGSYPLSVIVADLQKRIADASATISDAYTKVETDNLIDTKITAAITTVLNTEV